MLEHVRGRKLIAVWCQTHIWSISGQTTARWKAIARSKKSQLYFHVFTILAFFGCANGGLSSFQIALILEKNLLQLCHSNHKFLNQFCQTRLLWFGMIEKSYLCGSNIGLWRFGDWYLLPNRRTEFESTSQIIFLTWRSPFMHIYRQLVIVEHSMCVLNV